MWTGGQKLFIDDLEKLINGLLEGNKMTLEISRFINTVNHYGGLSMLSKENEYKVASMLGDGAKTGNKDLQFLFRLIVELKNIDIELETQQRKNGIV